MFLDMTVRPPSVQYEISRAQPDSPGEEEEVWGLVRVCGSQWGFCVRQNASRFPIWIAPRLQLLSLPPSPRAPSVCSPNDLGVGNGGGS